MNKAALLSIPVIALHLTVGQIVDAQQSPQTRTDLDPVYDPAYKGTAFPDRGGPFLIQVNDSFFRQTASYPRGETLPEGTFVLWRSKYSTIQIALFEFPISLCRIPEGEPIRRQFARGVQGTLFW